MTKSRGSTSQRLARLSAAMIIVGVLPQCRRQAPERVATLLDAQGVVERQDAASWRAVAPGFDFVLGDVVRTGASSTARLGVGGQGVIRMDANSRLRFLRGAAAQKLAPQIQVELGLAEVERAETDLSFLTPAGMTRVPAGTRLRVRSDGQAWSLEVLVGNAIIVKEDGEMVVKQGEGIRIRIGDAVVERFQLTVGQPIIEAEPASAPAPAAVPAETPEPDEKHAAPAHPGRADVTLAVGESGVIHDSNPSTTVRFRFDQVCPDEGVVEVVGPRKSRERFTGHGAVVLKLRAGAHRYRVRCAGDPPGQAPRATGALSLKRDNGRVPVPRRAPANTIDADGRAYTVLFQNRLPRMTLQWPRPPAGTAGWVLHIESPAGARALRVPQPRHDLPSGALPEGKHTWWYVAESGQQSAKTTVTILFDNAAPTAQFFRASSPASSAGAIAVDGVAMEDTRVSAAGKPVPVDEHGRFHAVVTPLEGDAAVAVRLDPPRGGVHYYIRRIP